MTNHEILQINYGASKEEIKKAFHRLALIHHPDKGGDVKKFIQIKDAYEVLMNQSEEPRIRITYQKEATTVSWDNWTVSNNTNIRYQSMSQKDLEELLRQRQETLNELVRKMNQGGFRI